MLVICTLMLYEQTRSIFMRFAFLVGPYKKLNTHVHGSRASYLSTFKLMGNVYCL